MTEQDLIFDAVILTGGRGRRLGGRDKAALAVAGTPMLQRAIAACEEAARVIVAGQEPHRGGEKPAGGGQVQPGGGPGAVPATGDARSPECEQSVQRIQHVQEDPPGGGPVAGIVAGLALVSAPWTLVLAVDQPDAARAVPGLLADAAREKRPDGGAERGAPAEASPEASASAEAPRVVEPPTADPAESESSHAATDLYCHVDAEGYPQWLLGLYRSTSLRAAAERVGTGHGVSVRSLTAGLGIARVLDGGAHVGDVDTWEDHARWEERLGHSG